MRLDISPPIGPFLQELDKRDIIIGEFAHNRKAAERSIEIELFTKYPPNYDWSCGDIPSENGWIDQIWMRPINAKSILGDREQKRVFFDLDETLFLSLDMFLFVRPNLLELLKTISEVEGISIFIYSRATREHIWMVLNGIFFNSSKNQEEYQSVLSYNEQGENILLEKEYLESVLKYFRGIIAGGAYMYGHPRDKNMSKEEREELYRNKPFDNKEYGPRNIIIDDKNLSNTANDWGERFIMSPRLVFDDDHKNYHARVIENDQKIREAIKKL